jgi:cell wall-associated NlpC family hydrolase
MRWMAFFLVSVFSVFGVAAVAEAAPYSQVVDNATKGRFWAPSGWGTSSYSADRYGKDYRFARPKRYTRAAAFKVRIPRAGDYAVYARWPANRGYNSATPIGIKTASGFKWVRVNQRTNGGRWVKLGTFKMAAGDGYYIRVSRSSAQKGLIIADAVAVREVSSTASSGGATGQDVVAEARKYIGTPYKLGGPEVCKPYTTMDCSCLTLTPYKKFGISLPDDPVKQYNYGRKVSSPAPGDLVFFNENGNGISHAGIYSGNGKIVHASNYFGRVVESEMKYIRGYVGARRLL